MPHTWFDCQIQNGDSPATFLASISGTQMTVTKITAGNLTIGQALAGLGVSPGTRIVGYEDGYGQAGTYAVGPNQSTPQTTVTATMTLPGRVEPLESFDRPLLGGAPADQALFLSGAVDRIDIGTIAQFPDGTAWQATAVLARWSGWVKLAVKQIVTLSSLDFSKASNSGLAPVV